MPSCGSIDCPPRPVSSGARRRQSCLPHQGRWLCLTALQQRISLGSVPAMVSSPDKFLGEKVVAESTDNTGGVSLSTRITLNVSTVTSHPGKTLAGCSYLLDVE
ncbi:hypothetical protein ACVILI_000738 [Mesorhizobium sp. USDA 4775]